MKHWYAIKTEGGAKCAIAYPTRTEAEARLVIARLDYPSIYVNATVVELVEVAPGGELSADA